MSKTSRSIPRRDFFKSMAVATATPLLATAQGAYGGSPRLASSLGVQGIKERYKQAREYLKSILYTPEEVASLILGNSPHGEKYDPDLGWVYANRRSKHGTDGSIVTYRYDPSGTRRMIHYADRPCRMNTYGDSFTHCDQVSDGETWQEVLAAHLIEPVRNYGIGGYSVYQAYVRMKREESRTPAQYIIFNIYHDDHYRNLHSWRTIRLGQTAESRGGVWGPPMPFVKVNPATGEFIEYPNPCPTPESLSKLQNIDWVYETFKDDFVLRIALARRNVKAGAPEKSYQDITQLTQEQRLQLKITNPEILVRALDALYTRAGIFASMRIVERVENFAVRHGKNVLYVLSYGGAPRFLKGLQKGSRFDQQFVDFLEKKRLRYVDLLEAHLADFAQFKVSVEDYLKRYYVGHYNPRGNVFHAFAIKNKLVEMLEPKPVPYRN